MSEQLHTSPVDVIVLGAGMAGLVAAVRLAEAGLRVTTVAKGYGSLRLSPATIDILGYRPDPVDSPAQALPGFAAAHPEHPYAQISPAVLAEAVQWLKDHVETYAYVGDSDANMLLPTALGVPRPSAVVPETMAAGDLRSAGPLLIAGIGVLKDFHPALVAENLEAATAARGRAVRARSVLLNPPTDGDADVGALALARRFEDAAFRAAVVAELRAAVTGEEAIGLPAVLGLDQARSVWAELQQATGRPVFEIPTPVPPSVPGLRLAQALQDRLRRVGGRFVLGAEAAGPELRNSERVGVRIRAAARVTPGPAGGWCWPPAVCPPAGSVSTRRVRSASRPSGCPCTGPARAKPASCRATSVTTRWRRRACGSTAACARSGRTASRSTRTCTRPAR